MEELRHLDLIIYGCTGFTGKLACEYMASFYGEGSNVKWGIAGRNKEKVEAIKNDICKLPDLEIFIVDSKDVFGLTDMAIKTKAIITFVGPYALYGSDLIKVCAEVGTHYADLTGELPWVKQMKTQLHDIAVEKKSRIVPTCGFDSVPSDLGVFEIVQYMKKEYNEECLRCQGAFVDGKGGFSGGTLASGLNLVENMAEEFYKSRIDPVYLLPDDAKHDRDEPDQTTYEWNEDFQSWTSPFVMSPVNCRMVRLSSFLLNYGSEFTYSESKLDNSKFAAMKSSFVNSLTGKAFSTSFSRGITKRFGPKPGEGPSEKILKEGFFHSRYIGISKDTNKRVVCDVKSNRDPGYGATARMLCEAGLCLALDDLQCEFGFITPAVLGSLYVARLKKAEMSFEISVS